MFAHGCLKLDEVFQSLSQFASQNKIDDSTNSSKEIQYRRDASCSLPSIILKYSTKTEDGQAQTSICGVEFHAFLIAFHFEIS